MKGFVLILCIAAVIQAIPWRNGVTPNKRTPVIPGFPRIVNGNQAHRGMFPYQVAMFLDGSRFCGGSIIAHSWILTAGHCGVGTEVFEIHLAAQNISNVFEGQVVITTTTGFVHEAYDSSTLINDICLVKISNYLNYGNYIWPINLVGRTTDQFVGQVVRVSGWGKTSDEATSNSQQLNYVDLTVMSNTECATFFSHVVASTICAVGTNAENICSGDSGSPLVIYRGERNSTQLGIVSFVYPGACENGTPSGYTRVSEYMAWIETTTGLSFPEFGTTSSVQ